MNIPRAAFFFLTFFFVSLSVRLAETHAAPANAPLGEDVGLAAARSIALSNAVKASLDACRVQSPASTFAFRMAEVIWRSNSLDSLIISEKLLGGRFRTSRAALMKTAEADVKSLPTSGAESEAAGSSFCKALTERIYEGREDLKRKFPDAVTALSAARGELQSLEDSILRENFTIGCLKGSSNRGSRDFDANQKTCSCNTEVFYKRTSKKERAGYFSYFESGNKPAALKYLSALPQFRKLTADLQACSGKAESGVKPTEAR